MSSSRIMITLALILCIFEIRVLSQSCSEDALQPYATIKNCNSESLYYTANYLANKCCFVSTTDCFEKVASCLGDSDYDANKAAQDCAKDLEMEVKDLLANRCNTSPAMYLNTLQSNCCVKTKLVAQKPGSTLGQLEGVVEKCYGSSGCKRAACPSA